MDGRQASSRAWLILVAAAAQRLQRL